METYYSIFDCFSKSPYRCRILIGMQKEEALKILKNYNVANRISQEDNVLFAFYDDSFNSNRVNLVIKNGIIIGSKLY